jgi:coniferyl-aldehyde dehydrogenase
LHWYLVDALAAGNHMMLKPSESTPRTSALLAEVLAEVFPIERVAVVQGGADVGAAFAASGGVNARNVARIAAGKFLNAGQTCIAPDDALVHEAERDAFVALLRTCVAHHYHDEMLAAITRALSTAPSTRLWAWLNEARVAGARVIPLHEGLHDDARRVLAPTVVLEAPDPLALMREETFGPVLPVMKYRISMKPWITSMSARDRCPCTCSTKPCAHQTGAGGVQRGQRGDQRLRVPVRAIATAVRRRRPVRHGCVSRPCGISRLLEAMSVFRQARWSATAWLHPPYGARAERFLRWLLR